MDLGKWDQYGPVMSFGDHLEDLRSRLVWSIVGLIPLFIAGLVFGKWIMAVLLHPLLVALASAGEPTRLIATSPLETFGAYLKVSLALTVLAGAPWVVLQIWLFMAPGLYATERRFVFFLVPLSAALSGAGVLFLYKVLLPISMYFLILFGTHLVESDVSHLDELPAGVVTPTIPALAGDPSPALIESEGMAPGSIWVNTELDEVRVLLGDGSIGGLRLSGSGAIAQTYRVGEYVSLVFMLGVVFVVAFQLPLVLMLLSWVGILEPRDITPYRKQVMFGCAIGGAVLTPQDPFSMLLLGAALYALFEFGIVLMRFVPARAVASGFGLAKTDADEGDE